MTSEAMDMEAIDMANGVKHPLSKGAMHVTIPGGVHVDETPFPQVDFKKKNSFNPASEDVPDAEFEDYPLEEKAMAPVDWQALVMKICQTVAVPLIVGLVFFFGVLRGEVTAEFGFPISWICSLIAVFSAGLIVARARK